ncbi:MAG: branched-chain amino acid ABC transporter permease [Alphaproteobacteria bacterium]|nr:branched-chain amino acid ABC transporter permease [Alphaproteobacteria bacterium]
MIQALLDGILVGSVVALGAIGLTMIMHLLRFANFSHAELLSIGAYAALVFDGIFAAVLPASKAAVGSLSLTWALFLAIIAAMVLTGLSAIVIDRLVFKRIRETAGPLSMVFASFGVALIIRSGLSLVFGLKTRLYSDDIVFAVTISTNPQLLIKPDQVFVFCAAVLIMLVLHLVLSRTTFGWALRAVAENPALAQVAGVRLSTVVSVTWVVGGALAGAAGVFHALDNQVSPMIGHNFVLAVFAATIVGGIGSVYGAVIGGFLVGIAFGLALVIMPPGYSPAMPFLIILAVLFIRPQGIFGEQR